MKKGNLYDSFIIYKREMFIFRANMRSSIIRSLIFPLVILIFFGSIGNGIFNIPIGITNLSNNPQSIQFMNLLQQNNHLSIKTVTSENNGLKMLKHNGISALIIIPPGFPKSTGGQNIYVYYSKSNLNSIGGVISYINSAAARFNAHIIQNSKIQKMFGVSALSNNVKFVSTSATTANYRDFLIAGVIAMVVAFGTIFAGGVTLITDRQVGNLKMFLITPINSISIVSGKILYGVTQAIIYAAITLIIAVILGARIAGGIAGLPWIFLIVIVLAFGLSSLAVMLASRIKKFEVYTMVANAITLPLWFLSGSFFPISYMPKWMATISYLNPLTYAVNGMKSVILTGYYPMSSILLQVAILAVFGFVLFFMAIKLFKNTV